MKNVLGSPLAGTTPRLDRSPNAFINILIEVGAPIPVEFQGKKPLRAGWQQLSIGHHDVDNHFGEEVNIGIRLGDASGVVDVDIDSEEAAQLADQYLPPTPSEFGRDSRPRSHRLYRVEKGTAGESGRHQFPEALGKGTIVEYRANGAQTVFPGSVHVSGETIRWDSDGEPAQAYADQLRECWQACRRVSSPSCR